MNVGVIFAGGVGMRMHSRDKPKQFLELHGKPIIIYTLEHFERHKDIDYVSVACVDGWISYFEELLERFFIKKVRWVVPGGSTGQESIYNALKVVEQECPPDTVVLIHDGVRPLINEDIISDNIRCVRRFGSAITSACVTETIVVVNGDEEVKELPTRDKVRIAKSPQSFYLKDIIGVHKQAISDGVFTAIDSCTLMRQYGKTLTMINGPCDNIKITTAQDYFLFRTIHELKENSQIEGY